MLPENGNPFDVPRPLGFTTAAPFLTALALALALGLTVVGRGPWRLREPPGAAGTGQVAA